MRKLILFLLPVFLISPIYAQENWGPAEAWIDFPYWPGFPTYYGFGYPSISSNDSLLFFRYRDYDSLGIIYRIAYSRFENGAWQHPFTIQTGSNYRVSGCPYFYDQIDTVLYYHTNNEGGYGGYDIWAIQFVNGSWGEPYNLGPTINTINNECCPSILNDGSRLYFITGDIIKYSEIVNGQYSTPEELPDIINSDFYESYPRISRDGQRLYFSRRPSWGMPPDLIFVSYYYNDEWQEPFALNENINIGNSNPYCPNPYRIGNYSPTFSQNCSKMYFSHFELQESYCDPFDFIYISELTTEISGDSHIYPSAFSLSAYPNPFNSQTNISIDGNLESVCEIAIYDITGRRIKAFAPAAQITWDGTDSKGVPLSSGIYFIKATPESLEKSLRITLIK